MEGVPSDSAVERLLALLKKVVPPALYEVVVPAVLGLQTLAGLLTCFFGYRLFRSALFWFGFLIGFILFALWGYDFAEARPSLSDYAPLISIAAAFGGGFVFGKLASAFYRVAVFLTGGVLALTLANHFVGDTLIGLLAFAVGGFTALFFEKPLIALSTAVVGAKITVDGLLLLNSYYHLLERVEWLSHGGRLDLFVKQLENNSPVDLYAAAWFVLSLLGFLFQYLSERD